MKIGIFDSGLGGLLVAKSIRKALPQYDYVYLGDTKRVPYGNRSHDTVFEFTREAVDYLFRKENCALVIIACNTSSARALGRIQREYLLNNFSDRRVLGVIIPVAEECKDAKRIGVLATEGTVRSNSFPDEILKINNSAKIWQEPAQLLVPIIESGQVKHAPQIMKEYLKPLMTKKIDTLVLGCTHYPILKKEFKKIVGNKVKILSQDEIIPKKLKNYLTRHPKIERNISKGHSAKILVTDETQSMERLAKKWFGKSTEPELIHL